MAEERAKCTFDQAEMNEYIYIPGYLKYMSAVAEDIKRHPKELQIPDNFVEWTREEQMKWHWQRKQKLLEINPERYFLNVEPGLMAPIYTVPSIEPLGLHYGMFQTAIQKLGDDEQNKLWLEDVRRLRKVGCYAQTELGHGSNVAGLETTATLDLATDEFVLHSPTVSSTKFWPGGLGLWANHAVVFARCIVKGVDYGPQAFLA